MKKYRYRLEPLLKVKAHIEKQRQRDHAEAMQKVYDQKGELMRIEAERQGAVEHQRQSLLGSLSLAELVVCSRYLTRLKKDTLAGHELLRGLERIADKKRDLLVAASKEKKIYEKLKEKQQAKFTEKVEELERKANDEIAVNSYRRKAT